MARRSKTRRVLKWTGTVVCALLLGMLVLSAWYEVTWRGPDTRMWLGNGRVQYLLARIRQPAGAPDTRQPYGWRARPQPDSAWPERLRSLDWRLRVDRFFNVFTVVSVPIWIPLLVIALPTAFLWWRDRRRIPPGHCQTCGYNLTGNVSGRCPECGRPVDQLPVSRRA